MQVETFEINETTSDGATDKLDGEAVALIERLGLTGQRALVSRAGDRVAVMPYQAMTEEEVAVYSALFPSMTPIGDYAAGPIPTRALQVAALAIEQRWFKRLEVWHKRTGAAKEDPLLVGVKVDPAHEFIVRERFLLARWGDALRPYAELVKEAAASARERLRCAVAKARAEIDAGAAMLDHLSDHDAIRWSLREPSAVHTSPRGF